ncbi:MAG: L,D-transpeptidase [Bacilli bacterium]|nr:L,D-transpeptidase [Bacilli bacterium]
MLPIFSKLDNGWYAVSYNDQVGFVCGDYVNETYIINKDVLYNACLNRDTYIYDEVGNVVANVPWLEFIKIYDEDDNRYFVQCADNIGYLSKEDVTVLTGTYAVVDISDQRLDLYNNTNKILSTPVVTGKDSTPSDLGLFDIDLKGIDVILRGADYESHVNYWMPYNGGEGLHDATWRDSFGGDIYHYGGSHGCINMPLEKVAEAYGYLNVGDKVLVKR